MYCCGYDHRCAKDDERDKSFALQEFLPPSTFVDAVSLRASRTAVGNGVVKVG
jgi:hypothetical protein